MIVAHDYERNGAAALFAALNILDGKVIGECHSRHRRQEFLKFIRFKLHFIDQLSSIF